MYTNISINMLNILKYVNIISKQIYLNIFILYIKYFYIKCISIYFKYIISPIETLFPKVITVNNLSYKLFYIFTCVCFIFTHICVWCPLH